MHLLKVVKGQVDVAPLDARLGLRLRVRLCFVLGGGRVGGWRCVKMYVLSLCVFVFVSGCGVVGPWRLYNLTPSHPPNTKSIFSHPLLNTLYIRSEPAKSTRLSLPNSDLEGCGWPPTREGSKGSLDTRIVKMQWERVEA